MAIGSRLPSKLAAAALCAAIAGVTAAPSLAADLDPLRTHRVKHVKRVTTTYISANWRDRCAYAGHYCLYAEYGYVYHYPYDDRPIAFAARARRYR